MRFLWNVMQSNTNTCFATFFLSLSLSLARSAGLQPQPFLDDKPLRPLEFMGFWCAFALSAAALRWSNSSQHAGMLLNRLFMFIYLFSTRQNRDRENFFSRSFDANTRNRDRVKAEVNMRKLMIIFRFFSVARVNVHLQKLLLLTLFSVSPSIIFARL